MPTVHREGGFAFRIYTNDHPPPHVHVRYAGEQARVTIGDADEPARIYDAGTMRPPELLRAVRIVDRRWRELLDGWREIHG